MHKTFSHSQQATNQQLLKGELPGCQEHSSGGIVTSMKRLVVALLLCTSVIGAVHAQGLKGFPPCQRSASQPPPLIAGESSKDRWAKFFAVQPKLIGMRIEQVEKALGSGKGAGNAELHYEIIKTKYPSTPGTLATIELSVHFENGAVHSYQVKAVHWSG